MGLQLGATGVVLETVFSGITELPLQTFAWFMLPIHLVIGLVEAAVTTVVLLYIWREMPELLKGESVQVHSEKRSLKRLVIAVLIAAVLISGALSWFASERPDGLEWAILQTAGHAELQNSSWLHETLAQWQQRLALLADYQTRPAADVLEKTPNSPVDLDTSAAGITGVILVLAIVGIVGAGCHLLAKGSAN